jgi:hypothetical protein
VTRRSRRTFTAQLATLVAGVGLAAIPAGTSPARRLVRADDEPASVNGYFPTIAEGKPHLDAALDHLDALLQRVWVYDKELANEIDVAVGAVHAETLDWATATLHEHLLATYRQGARLLIEIRPGGAS